MTNIEIAKFVAEITGKKTDSAVIFLHTECGIEGLSLENTDIMLMNIGQLKPLTLYKNNKEIDTYNDNEAMKVTQNLMPLLTDEEKAKVLEVVQGMKERSKPAKASGEKSGDIVINNTNNNSAQASNYNYNDIKNLSELSAYVSNSTAVTNKVEIQNTLSALEDAKDGDSAESYVGLLLKLVELLSKDGILPPFVGKLAGGLKKWFK